MLKLVVEPIDGIQVGLVYGTWIHCYTSKWRLKTTKLTPSVESPSQFKVSISFATGTFLLEHSSQAGIAQEESRKVPGMSANTWMQSLCCDGGVFLGCFRELHLFYVPHIICG